MLFNLFRQFDASNGYHCGMESFEPDHRSNPVFDTAMVLLNGLITSDKSCLSLARPDRLAKNRKLSSPPELEVHWAKDSGRYAGRMSAANQISDRQRDYLLKGHGLLRRPDMIRHWLLSEEDLQVINQRRRDHNRLGFAVQLCLLRYPGWPLGP